MIQKHPHINDEIGAINIRNQVLEFVFFLISLEKRQWTTNFSSSTLNKKIYISNSNSVFFVPIHNFASKGRGSKASDF